MNLHRTTVNLRFSLLKRGDRETQTYLKIFKKIFLSFQLCVARAGLENTPKFFVSYKHYAQWFSFEIPISTVQLDQ